MNPVGQTFVTGLYSLYTPTKLNITTLNTEPFCTSAEIEPDSTTLQKPKMSAQRISFINF